MNIKYLLLIIALLFNSIILCEEFNNNNLIILEKAQQKAKKEFFNEALDLLNSAIKNNPFYKEAYLEKAKIFLYLKRYSESEKFCKKCIEIDPLYTEAYLMLIKIYSLNKNISSKENFFINTAQKFPYNENILLSEAYFYYKEKKFSKALELLKEAEKYNPLFSEIYFLKSKIYHELDKKKEALKILNEYLKKHPDNLAFKLELAKNLFYLNKPEKSIQVLKSISFQQLNHLTELNNYANFSNYTVFPVLKQEEFLTDFVKIMSLTENYSQIIKFKNLLLKNNLDVLDMLGFCYEKLGKLNEAEKKYYAKKNLFSYSRLYNIYRKKYKIHNQKRNELAENIIYEANKLKDLGKREIPFLLYWMAVKLYPVSGEYRFALAKEYFNLNYLESAYRQASIAEELIPDNIDIVVFKSKVKERLDNNWLVEKSSHINTQKIMINLNKPLSLKADFILMQSLIDVLKSKLTFSSVFKVYVNNPEFVKTQFEEKAKKFNIDYVIDLSIVNVINNNHVLKVTLYNMKTLEKEEKEILRTGEPAAYLLAEDIYKFLIEKIEWKSKILALKKKGAIVNVGLRHGVNLKNKFIIESKKNKNKKFLAEVKFLNEWQSFIEFIDPLAYAQIGLDDIAIYSKKNE